jgi:hypothetical protein
MLLLLLLWLQVYGVDVGHGQVMGSIAQDPRVTVMEKTNLRHMAAGDLPEQVGWWALRDGVEKDSGSSVDSSSVCSCSCTPAYSLKEWQAAGSSNWVLKPTGTLQLL